MYVCLCMWWKYIWLTVQPILPYSYMTYINTYHTLLSTLNNFLQYILQFLSPSPLNYHLYSHHILTMSTDLDCNHSKSNQRMQPFRERKFPENIAQTDLPWLFWVSAVPITDFATWGWNLSKQGRVPKSHYLVAFSRMSRVRVKSCLLWVKESLRKQWTAPIHFSFPFTNNILREIPLAAPPRDAWSKFPNFPDPVLKFPNLSPY